MVVDGVLKFEIVTGDQDLAHQTRVGVTQRGKVLCNTKTWDCNRGKGYKSSFFRDNNHPDQPVPKKVGVTGS